MMDRASECIFCGDPLFYDEGLQSWRDEYGTDYCDSPESQRRHELEGSAL